MAALLGVLLVTTAVPSAAQAVSPGPGAVSKAACTGGPDIQFTDSLGSFGTYVEWMVCEGITTGYEDNTFRFGQQVTRGEVAAFLYRMSGETYQAGTDRDFRDVKSGDSFYPAVMWMRSKGITTGYPNGAFGRNLKITRGELATFLYRYAGEPPFTMPRRHPFPDVRSRPSAFYYAPTAWVKSIGVTGYSDGTFRPVRNINRGETSKFHYMLDQVVGATATRPRWTETRLNLYSRNDWKSAAILSELPAQTRVNWERDAGDLALVEVGGTTGWVNKGLLSKGQPGTTAKPFAKPTTFEQKVANNIARWCWNPAIKTTTGRTSYARMRFQYFTTGKRILISKSEELEITNLIPDPNHVSSKAIQLHECAHLLQYRAYGYIDAVPVGGQLSTMDRDLNRVYREGSSTGATTVQGVEHLADCMAVAMGARLVTDEYTVGYGGECTDAHLASARQLIAGKRFSTPSAVDSEPAGRAVPIAPWQTVEHSDVPVVATDDATPVATP